MDDFREWLSDNLRYFMLGFGILAVVLILFFGVRFISSKFRKSENNQTETGDTAGDGNTDSDAGKQKKHRQQPRNRKQHRQQASWN